MLVNSMWSEPGQVGYETSAPFNSGNARPLLLKLVPRMRGSLRLIKIGHSAVARYHSVNSRQQGQNYFRRKKFFVAFARSESHLLTQIGVSRQTRHCGSESFSISRGNTDARIIPNHVGNAADLGSN